MAPPCPRGLWSSRVTEADIFDAYLRRRFGVGVDLLERESTNCGTNVTNALWMLTSGDSKRSGDSDPGRHHAAADGGGTAGAGARCAIRPLRVVHRGVEAGPDGRLRYADAPADVWPLPRFASMLMGEVERLRDDEHGTVRAVAAGSRTSTSWNEVQAAYELLADAQLFSARCRPALG